MLKQVLVPILMCLLCMPALGAKTVAPIKTEPQDFISRVKLNLPIKIYRQWEVLTTKVEGQPRQHVFRERTKSFCGKAFLPPIPTNPRERSKQLGVYSKRTKDDCPECIRLATKNPREVRIIKPTDPEYKMYKKAVAEEEARMKLYRSDPERYKNPKNRPASTSFPSGIKVLRKAGK